MNHDPQDIKDGLRARGCVPAAFESAFSYFERNLTSFYIMFYHPGRWDEEKPAHERSFSRRSRKVNYYPLIPTAEMAKSARDLAERHGLRGFDALHLAAALDLPAAAGPEVLFSTVDERLREAARNEGIRTISRYHA